MTHEVDMQVWINDQGPYAPESFERNVEQIDVTAMTGHTLPDPAWRHVDDAGHFHAYAADGTTPTLYMVCGDRPECPYDVDDSHDCQLVHICSICGERIEPAVIRGPPDTHRKYVPGRESWTLTLTIPEPIGPGDPVSVRFAQEGYAPDYFAVGRVILQEQDDRFEGTRVTIEGGQRWEVLQP